MLLPFRVSRRAVAATVDARTSSDGASAASNRSVLDLVLAAAGAPIFFLLLLFLAVRERLQTA